MLLRVSGPRAVQDAFARIHETARRYLAARMDVRPVEGILVTPMQAPPLAELLVGVRRDPGLGPVLTIGAGGTWVEWIRDVAHRVLPVETDEVLRTLDELKVGAILAGARGGPAGHREGVAAVARALSHLLEAAPDIGEVEVNPLFVYPDEVVPVDVRIFLATGHAGPPPAGGAASEVPGADRGPGEA